MKKTVILCLFSVLMQTVFPQEAKEIVRKAYNKMEGDSHESLMSMSIVRPSWSRTLVFKTWAKGTAYSMVLITEPAKEKGQVFLKRKNEMWNWIPSIGRMVKLPPSMLSQGWMGSDYTNDDLLKGNSWVDDYDHVMLGREVTEGYECYKIKMIPHAETAVVWGSIVVWISVQENYLLRSEYYDEDGQPVKTETASRLQQMDGRMIPTHFEIIPAGKQGHKTVVEIKSIRFNIPLDEKFFSLQNMKNLR